MPDPPPDATTVDAGLPPLPLPRESEFPFDPPPEYALLRASTPVTKVVCPTGITAWLVSRYGDVREVLGDARRFRASCGQAAHVLQHMTAGPVVEGEFVRMDGPEHLRYRRHLAPEVLSRNRMAELEPFVRQFVEDQVDALAAMKPPVDLYEQFAKPLTTAVIAQLIDVPLEDRQLFQRAAGALFDPQTTSDGMVEALSPLLDYLASLVALRRSAPGPDALSRMISRSENSDGGFTDLELIVMTAALLIAGFDTTASLMTHGFLALLTRPDQLADLRDRPERAATAAEELVRYLAAGVGLLREVAEETHIGGQRLAKGDYVVLAVQSANRDPQLCTDPDGLDLGRRPTQHLGFGHGPHQCVGQQLARLELATVLEVLPRRLPSLRLAAPLADIPFKSDSVVRGPAILPVTWDNPVRGRRTGEAG